MKKHLHLILQHAPRYVLSLMLLGCMAMPVSAADLVNIKNVTLVESDFNDGDSFKVNAAGRELHLRLYYVDCLETAAGGFVKDRILQQQRHFALKNTGAVLDFGKQATEFARRALFKPFTIHTSYAKAPGGSGRYYAFVETHDGHDLGRLLIKHGLARIHGVTRSTPDGASSKTMRAQLGDLRDAAMLKRAGIWRATDPDLLVELRDQDRGEDRKPYNLNAATSEQLQQIPGIGPVLACRIIAARPYRSVQELLQINGIGARRN